MMQTKQNKKLICAILVLAMMLTALAGTLLAISAEVSGYGLTVNFTSEAKVSYHVRVGEQDSTPVELVSGTPVDGIPYDSALIVRVTPIDGYTLKSVTDANGDPVLVSEPIIHEDTKVPYFEFTEHSVTSDNVYTVVCEKREFKVVLKPSAFASQGANSIDYTVEGVDAANLSYTYEEGPASILLPDPTKSGYTFVRWEVRGNEGETYVLSNNKLPNTFLNRKAIETGIVSIHPVFTKNPYTVTRHDYAYDIDAPDRRGERLGGYEWEAHVATQINAQTDGGTVAAGDTGALGYVGYRLCNADQDAEVLEALRNDIYKTVVNANGNSDANVVYRYYKPIVYNLKYMLAGGDVMTGNSVTTHTFNRTTALPTPTRTGYTFVGWLVNVDEKDIGVVTSLDARNEDYAVIASDHTIVLTAQWVANEYAIAYDLDGGMAGENPPSTHIYDATTTIPAPTKTGYHFKGWYINGTDRTTTDDVLGAKELPLNGSNTISLKAKWQPKSFTVLLDANLGEYTEDTVRNLAEKLVGSYSFGMELDGVSSGIPMRAGYTFGGFYTAPEGGTCFIDAQGEGVVGSFWTLDDADDDGYVTLYARWNPNPYQIKLEYDRDLVLSVTIGDEIYNEANYPNGIVTVYYRVPIAMNVVVKDGYKVTTVGGKVVPHMTNFVYDYRHETADDVLNLFIEVLPALPTPAMKVDYPTETLLPADGGRLPEGNYSLLVGAENAELWCDFAVTADGTILMNGTPVDAIKLIESCFGNTLSVIRRGRAGFEADSDPLLLSIPARPAAPEIEYTATVGQDRITITVLSSNAAELEFSISANPSAPSALWQSSPEFVQLADGTALQPGTTYYVFVRVKGTETTPGGLSILPPLAIRTEPVTDEIGLILPIICLGLTLLCQLVAIVLLLIRRAKIKKNATMYSVAPLWMLAVRFLPAGALPVVLVLAALVVLAQIILVYLLMTTDLVRRHKPEPDGDDNGADGNAPTDPDAAAMRVFDEQEDGAYIPVAPVTDAEPMAYTEENDTEPVPEAEPEDYEFIDPAPAVQYSLPDDEPSLEGSADFEYTEATEETDSPVEETEPARTPTVSEYDEIDDSYLAENEFTPDDSDDIDDSRE